MNNKEQKKREIAQELSAALRAYNSIVSPCQWIGHEEIDAVYSALAYSDGDIDVAFQQLICAAERVQEGNMYTWEVHYLLKKAKTLFRNHSFTDYRIHIVFELSILKRIFR